MKGFTQQRFVVHVKTDTGVGMTGDELIANLNTPSHGTSGTSELMYKLLDTSTSDDQHSRI